MKIINYKTICVDGERFLLYKKGKLYISEDLGKTASFIVNMPMPSKKYIFSKFRLTTRLLRLEPRASYIIGNGRYLISYSGKIYCVDINKRNVSEELEFRKGMNNPLIITDVNGIEGFLNGAYYGEYFSNNQNDEVCIYRKTDNGWQKVYAFPPNTVYHIHGIVADKKRKCLYILTGDKNNESAIWEARNNFKEVKPLLIGNQQYRACVAFPFKNGIIYATDTSREQNHIYYAEEKDGIWQTSVISVLHGPCIYGTESGGKYYFATSVEPDDTLSGARFRFTYKLGKGVKDRLTHIIELDQNSNLKEIFNAKKDILPMLLFQFGNCIFPNCKNNEHLIFCPISVKRYDGKTIIMK